MSDHGISAESWCTGMVDALSKASACPTLDAVEMVRTLLALTPSEYLTREWIDLKVEARSWVEAAERGLPRFRAARTIVAAQAAKPRAVPAWQGQVT